MVAPARAQRHQPTLAVTSPVIARRYDAPQGKTFKPTPLEKLAGTYQGSSAVPAYLTKTLSVQKQDPGAAGQEPGKDRPKDKPKGAPDESKGDAKPDEKAKDAKDAGKDGKGKGDGEEGAAGPGTEKDEDAGPRKKAIAAGAGRGLPGGGGGDGDEEAVFVPPPLPEVESGPVMLYRAPLELRDSGPAFAAPSYLTHRAEQPAKTLDGSLRNYADRFAEASGEARRVYDQILSRLQTLNSAARSSEDRRFDGRQQALNLGLAELGEALARARALLAEARAGQLLQLDFIARATRRVLLRTAGSGAGALEGRAKRIDTDLAPHWTKKSEIVALPAGKAAEINQAQADAEKGLSELAANPADKLKGTGTAKGESMRAAQEEAIIRDVKFPVAEAKSRLETSTKAMTDSLGKQGGPLEASLCPSFCPFEGFKAVLRGEAVKAVWSAHGSSLKKLRESADSTRTSLEKSYSQAETALIEQHNQMRARLIEGARQRDRAERDQGKQQAARNGGALVGLAGAQGRAVAGIDEKIGRRRRSKEEEFARSVISYSQGLMDQGLETGRKQPAQIAGTAEDAQEKLDKVSETGSARFKDGAAQSAALLGRTAEQSVAANRQMIDGVAESMGKLADPIRDAMTGFLNRVGGQSDSAIENLGASLGKSGKRVTDGFAGPVDKGEGEGEDAKPAEPKGGKAGKGGKAAQPGKEAAPDPAVTACQARCPKPEKTEDDGKDVKKDDKKKDDGAAGAKQEYPDGYRDRLKGYKTNPLAEPTVADYLTNMPGIVEGNLTERAHELNQLLTYSNSEPSAVLNQLRGLTRLQGRAVEEAYPRGTLRKDLDWYLNAGNAVTGVDTRVESIFAARAYLNGDTEAGAVHELNAAVNWSNDSKQIDTVLQGLTADQMKSMKARFPAELKVIRDDLNDMDGKVWDKLTEQKLGEAEGLRLKEKLITAREDYRGEQASDKSVDAVSDAMKGTGSSRLGGAAQFADMERGYESRAKRQEKERKDLIAGFALTEGIVEGKDEEGSTLLKYAGTQQPYYAYVPGEGPNGSGGKWEVRTQASEAQRRLLGQLIKTGEGSPESRAARLAVELGRVGGGKPDRVRTATDDMDLNQQLASPEAYKAALEKKRKMYELVDQWAPNPKGDGTPRSAEDIQKDVADRLAGPLAYDKEKAKYVRSLVTGGPGDAKSMVVRLDYAMEGAGTNNEVLKQTLGSMTRDQFQKVREEYDLQHPKGPDLLTRLGIRGKSDFWASETSGDAANELELLSMGVPRNERERAEVAAMQMKQQIRDADGTLGPTVAGPEFDRLESDYKRLMSVMGIGDVGFDKDGEFVCKDVNGEPTKLGNFDENGKFKPTKDFSSDDLALAMTIGKISAESYKAATDAVADAIATALVVTAAIVTTALTGGAAASIWIPVLVTAAAGVASMGVKYAIKGGRYGSEEMMFDLASTIIQAATAGIGAAAGTALRGGGKAVGALSKSWRMSEQALATAAKGGGQAATKALPAMTLGQDLFVGALSSGFSGGAMAAINPDSYRGDNYASDILHGIIKGSVSGAVGAGVTRGVMGGVTNLSRGMGARSGAAEALAKGMPLADAQRFATARSRLFGTSALTEVGGRVVGSAASGMASRATEIAYDSAIRKQHIAAGQFWSEVGSAGLQNAIQAFGEGAIDRAIRSRSRSRLREHAFTTRDDISDYRQRGAQAVVDEGVRRGMIKLPSGDGAPATVTSRPTVTVDEDGAPRPMPSGDEERAVLPMPHSDEGDATLPAPRPDAEIEAASTRTPATDGAEDAESVRMHDPEVDGPLVSRTADRTLTAANDNPGRPIHVQLALDPAAMVSMGRIPEDSIIIHPNSKSLEAANDNYRALLAADPNREAAVYRNPVTGDYVVIQGGPGSVAAIRFDEIKGERGPARSVSRRGLPEAGGYWLIEYHYHPNREGETGTHILRRLPSGANGDFAVLWHEMKMYGLTERTSRVKFDDNGVERHTEFGIRTLPDGTTEFWIHYPHPATGAIVQQPPFQNIGDYHKFIRKFQAEGTAGGGEPGVSRTADRSEGSGLADPARLAGAVRAGHDDQLTAGNRADIDFISQRMGEEIGRDPRLPAPDPTVEQLNHALARAQTPADVQQAVAKMGLVGEPDSMIRLAALMNDKSMQGPAGREKAERVARAVLDATREHMIRSRTLAEGDELMMFFHGAPDGQLKSYQEKGIDMSLASPKGATEDLKAGSYSSQDLQSADRYLEGKGRVLPWIARKSELGNVLDLRSSSPLRARFEQFAMANMGRQLPEGRIKASLTAEGVDALKQGRRPGVEHFNVEERGVLFEAFRNSLASDPDPALRKIAANPDIVLADLGGPLTSGKSRGFVTDQAAVKSQRVADMINDQLGFPRVGVATNDDMMAVGPLRTADTQSGETKTAPGKMPAVEQAATVTQPKPVTIEQVEATPAPPIPEPKLPPLVKPAHETQALANLRPTRKGDFHDHIRAVVDSVTRLAQDDRAGVMAVLHAPTDADAQDALGVYRKRLLAKGLTPEQAEMRVRRLDFARAVIGSRFQIETAHLVATKAKPVAIPGVTDKQSRWIQEFALLRFLHNENPAVFQLLHDRFVDGVGTGGRNRADRFEKYVRRTLRVADPQLYARIQMLDRDDAVGRMLNKDQLIDLDTDKLLQAHNMRVRPETQMGPEITDPALVQAGHRVDHKELGRGTVIGVEKGIATIHVDGTPDTDTRQVPIAGGGLHKADDPDTRFGDPPPIRDASEQDEKYASIAKHRHDAGLADYAQNDGPSGTVARIELAGEAFHGTNSGLDPGSYALEIGRRRELHDLLVKHFGLTTPDLGKGKFINHAEAEAMIRAYLRFGALPEVLEIFVDRPTCDSCRPDLIRLARLLGVKELRIYYSSKPDRQPLIRR